MTPKVKKKIVKGWAIVFEGHIEQIELFKPDKIQFPFGLKQKIVPVEIKILKR